MTGLPPLSSQGLAPSHADLVMRAIEASADVRRRYQFFIWLQSYLEPLIPLKLAVCGAWHRVQKDIVFEQFNSMVVPEEAMQVLLDRGSALMSQVMREWCFFRAEPLRMRLTQLSNPAAAEQAEHLLALGISELVVHGVARPQRCSELETLFVLGAPNQSVDGDRMRMVALLVPHLHTTYLRMLATELELNIQPVQAARRSTTNDRLLTRRELQILALVRDGRSNQEIGTHLSISALTAKNHIQKLLRKLGASNRTQAVSRALALGLLAGVDARDAEAALPSRPMPLAGPFDTEPVR